MYAFALSLMVACSVGADQPATPGSASAGHAEQAQAVEALATAVYDAAEALTSQVDESRRAVAEGRSTSATEIEKIEALNADVQAKNAALQAAIQALESDVRASARDALGTADLDLSPQDKPRR